LLDLVGSLLLGLGVVTWLRGSTLFSLEPGQARGAGMVLVLFGALLTLPFLIAVIRGAARRGR
jgi:hypothetical protein